MKTRLHRAFDQRNKLFEFTMQKNEFYPFTVDEKTDIEHRVRTHFTFDRTSLNTMLFGRLLLKGHSVDEVLNYGENSSQKLKDDYDLVKTEFLNVLPKNLQKNLPEEKTKENDEQQAKYNKYAAESYIYLLQQSMDYVNDKIRANGTFSQCSIEDKKKLTFINSIINDGFQEYLGIPDESRAILNAQHNDENSGKDYIEEFSKLARNTTFAIDTYDKIAEHAAALYENYYSNNPQELGKIDGTNELLQGIVPLIAAQKMVEKSIGDAPDKKFGELELKQKVFEWRVQAQTDTWNIPDEDMQVINSIMGNETKRNAFLGELLSGNDTKLFDMRTADDGSFSFDFTPLLDRAKEIDKIPVERFQMEDLLTEIADRYLEEENRRDDIFNLSGNEKIEYVMNLKVLGTAGGHVYGENYKANDTPKQKVEAFVNELITDKAEGKEVYAYLTDENGLSRMHRINSGNEINISEEPAQLWNMHEKEALIGQIEKIKAAIDSEGRTLWDSDAFVNLRKTLNKSIKDLKSTLDPQKRDEILDSLAASANKYYYEKIDQDQNRRRKVRFNAASILRNVNKKDFAPKLDLKQNILEKAAVLVAKYTLESGDENLKAQARSALDPAHPEELRKVANRIASKEPFSEMLNGKSEKELQEIFAKYPDVPEVHAMKERAKANRQPQHEQENVHPDGFGKFM